MPDNTDIDWAAAASKSIAADQTAMTVRNNVQNAVGAGQSPDQAAQYKHLAAYVGVPAETVAADPKAAQQQATAKQFDADNLVSKFPHTAQFMTAPANTAIMHDDVPATATVEQHAAALPRGPAPIQPTGAQVGQDDGKTLGQSLADVPMEFAKGLGGAFNKMAGSVNVALGAFPTLYDKAASLITGQQTSSASDAYFKQFVDPLMNNAPAFAPAAGARFPEKAASAAGGLLGMLSQITLSGTGGAAAPAAAGASVPEFVGGAVEHGMKSMLAPALSDAVDTGRQVYQATGDAGAAARAAQAQYVGTSAAGIVPMNAPGSFLTRAATGAVSGVALGEGTRELMNSVNPASMQQPFSADDAILSGLTGAVMGGVMGPRAEPAYHDAVRQTYIDAGRADAATQAGEQLAALGQSAAAAKLRERDPQAFHDFVQNVTEDGGLKDVYITAAQLGEVLNQSGVTPEQFAEKLPDAAAQLHEAQQTNGDVRIPVADYATHIAGGPVDANMLPHLKTAPDAMTYQEAQDHFANQKQDLTEQASKIAADQDTADTKAADGKGVYDHVLDQLNTLNRNTPDVNKSYATLMRAYFETQAERNGGTAQEAYVNSGFNVKGESLGTSFDQSNRGAYDPQTATVALLKSADLSSFLHESSHFFLDNSLKLASTEGASQGLKDDAATVLTHLGVTGDDALAQWHGKTLEQQRDAHETFARGFEAFLMEGKAPTVELQGLFSRFRSWLVNVYKSLSSLNVQLSPEVRGVMDRMLASDDAIKQAEQVRGFAPLFRTAAEAGVPEGDFAGYQALGREATDQAVADIESKSMKDMKWLSNAKSKFIKAAQREAATERGKIKDEATKEVMAQPVEQARTYLKTGKLMDADGNELPDTRPIGSPDIKIDKAALAEMYPKGALGAPDLAKLRGLTGDAGLHPDMLAEQFGFNSGHELIRQLVESPPVKDTINQLTDQRMLERHGELTDPVSIERAAEAAIHNDARARFMATGLKILAKSPLPARQIERAAKEAADAAVAAKKIADLRPGQYSAAEARSNKEAIKLAPEDPAGAVVAQRAALLNNRLFRSSLDAVTEMQKAVTFLKRFNRDTIRGKIDIDIRDQIDDLLGRFDLRTTVPTDPTRAQVNLQTWIESQREAGYQPAFTADMIDPSVRTHFQQMTVEQMRGLRDTVAALEHIGRERRTILIDGKKVDVGELIKNEMIPKMQQRGDKFTDAYLVDRPEDRYTNPIAIALDKFKSRMRGLQAQLKPQEFKRNEYDNHELLGPFGRAIFDRVFDANYRKVDMLKGLSNDYQAKVDELGRPWQDSLRDQVENTKLIDPDKSAPGGEQVPMRFSRGRMIGLAIHVGNESNFDKVTKGWGWAPADVWSFLHDNMGEKDWKAVQSVWDQYEKHFPDMQAMARRLGNTSPDKIEPRPVTTKFGEIRGGYAAIKYDSLRSRRGEKEQAGLAINPADNLFNRDYFRPDTTTNGAMNARIDGYTDRVDLDFHHIARSLSDSIHDLAYREALIDSNKIIENGDFRRQFKRTYGPEAYASLRDWIGQTANSENFDRQAGALGQFLAYTRTGIVMTGISLRVSTVLKHGGSAGIKTIGYFVGGGEKYLASRFASMGNDYKNQTASAIQKFPEIRARALQQDRDFRVTSTALFEPDSLMSKAERFGHAWVALSDLFTAVPTAWAAYDRAITEGIPVNQGGTGAPVTEAQAVAYANKIVREAHGSNIETARSMVLNTSSEALKMFTTLYGFMNTTYGQALDGWDKLHTAGISNPAVLARSFMALIVPAIWAGYLTHGGPDKDGWAAWAGKSIAVEVAGMVPFVRDAAAMFEGYSHAGQVGVESWLNTIVAASKDVVHLAQGKQVKAPIKNIANAVGVGLHIPGMGQLGTSAQYLSDVAQGKQHPQNAKDVAAGIAFGPPKTH